MTTTKTIRVLSPHLPSADAITPYLRRIDETRIYSNYGPLHREFAKELAAFALTPDVTLTCNGTSAIEVALRARDV